VPEEQQRAEAGCTDDAEDNREENATVHLSALYTERGERDGEAKHGIQERDERDREEACGDSEVSLVRAYSSTRLEVREVIGLCYMLGSNVQEHGVLGMDLPPHRSSPRFLCGAAKYDALRWLRLRWKKQLKRGMQCVVDL
jgi:hypothetical protein